MSLRKLCLYAMLATALAFASAEGLNHYIKNSGVPETGVLETGVPETGVPEKTWPSAATLTTGFPVESQAPPAGFRAKLDQG